VQNFRQYTDNELIQAVTNLTRQLKFAESEVIRAIVELAQRDIHLQMGCSSVKSFLQNKLKMSEDQASKRSQTVNLIRHYPQFLEVLTSGKTHVSHLSLCAPKVTKENASKIIEFLPEKSKQELQYFLNRINPDGSLKDKAEVKVDLVISCSRTTLESFERARKLVAKDWKGTTNEDVLTAALEALLDKIDPIRKAERADRRAQKINESTKATPKETSNPLHASKHSAPLNKECPGAAAALKIERPSRYIPAAVRHQVLLRDEGRCTFVAEDGTRCEETARLTIDHITPYSQGGDHTLTNLRTLCPAHNNYVATTNLGREFMSNFIQRLRQVARGRQAIKDTKSQPPVDQSS
jgi:5-methylcytosine-specific restriction endonuclease McrA